MQPSPLSISLGSYLKPMWVVLVVFIASGATCSRGFRNPFNAYGPPAPEVLSVGASLDRVIAAVNQNAAKIVSYQTNNASITVPGMPSIPLLRGNIVAERPCRVRLQASTALTGPEVDIGSNEELFWFWAKRNDPPAIYFCRHDQFVGSAAQQVMPIEPQWLLDALGMAQFSSDASHEGPFPHGNGTIEIRSIVQTRSGTMTKSTVLDATRAWVLEQHIYDSTGTRLASTRTSEHRYYEGIGVSLPQQIEINIPATQLNLSIDVGTVQLNSLVSNPEMWKLPVMSGYQQHDLGSAPQGAVPAMQSAASRDWGTGASPAFVGMTPEMVQRERAEPQYSEFLEESMLPTGGGSRIDQNFAPASMAQRPSPEQPATYPVRNEPTPAVRQQLPPGGVFLSPIE